MLLKILVALQSAEETQSIGEMVQDTGHIEEGFFGAEFWVAVSFVLFLALLAYLNVHKMINGALDRRSEKIRSQLDEARILKEEAQSELAQLQRRQREALAEAEEIRAHAREEAETVRREMEDNVEALIARRSRLAKERITQAEASAIKEVRNAAVEIATDAAERVITEQLSPERRQALVDQAISRLDRKLH